MSGMEKREQLSIRLAFRRDELSRLPVVDSVPNRAFDMFMFTHGGKEGRLFLPKRGNKNRSLILLPASLC